MDMTTPQAWRSEAFAEDLIGDDADAQTGASAWTPRAAWLLSVPVAVSVLGGAAAFLQTLA